VTHGKIARRLAGRPIKVRRCFRCQSTQHLARFCTKADNSGNRDGKTAQVTVSACCSDTCMSPAACAFSRDVITGARADGPTDVCAFSRDEPTVVQVCVDNGIPVNDESNEWAFGEFPKIDTARNCRHCSTLMLISKADNARGWSIVARRSRVCAVAQYAVLEANAKVNGRGPFSHPTPPKPLNQFRCHGKYITMFPNRVDVQNLVGIDSAVTDLRMREKNTILCG